MTGLNVALNTAVSGLFANQQAIAATSENIANVNTADYTRREARFFTDAITGQFAGVDVNIVRAAVDRFLQGATYRSLADASATNAIAEGLARVEASLGAPGDNISFANELDRAFAALTTLGANPSSPAAKAEAVSALDAAFAAFSRTRAAIVTETQAADAQISLDIDRANALLKEVWRLNSVVPESDGAADLLDARLSELSKLISITVTRNESGQVEVSAGGQTLANAGGYTELGFAPGTPARLTLSSVNPDSGGLTEISADFGGSIASGEIRGLLDLRNIELPRLDAIVAGAARGVAGQLNAVYALNVPVGATAPDVSYGALIVEDADGNFSVNGVIANDPSRFATARPGAGGVGGANDGTGAGLLADLGSSAAAGDVRQAVGLIGSASSNAARAANTNIALANELTARASAQSGVNLDEELSNLIVFQRAYGANARVIAAIDEMWQALVSIL
ncbi:MAG: flagellar hook-associated protein FlgK [Amphiplicatus sp.]